MKIRPLHDRVLVERLDAEQRTPGGLVLPDTAKEKPKQGRVVAAGEGRITEDGKRLALDIKVGDVVLFGSYAGTEVKIEGKEYLILKEEDVLGVIEESAKTKKA